MKLIHPLTKKEFSLKENENKFEGIPDLFIDDGNKLNLIQSDFYNDVKFPNYNEISDFGTLLDKLINNSFVKKLDKEIGYGKTILEGGCGTGQLSLALSRFGREIHSIDLSKGSLIMAKKFASKNNINNVNFYRMNIFNLFFPKNFFDVVISNGVLHHTHDCRLAFSKLCEVVKFEGIIVVGLYHKYARFVQKIRQALFPILREKLKYLDKRFKENISNQKKYAWFMDQYKNPFETTHTYKEVLGWFKENNIEFLNSLPFDFNENKDLFNKVPERSGASLMLEEISLAFSRSQVYQGGFFIMIGKKLKK